MAEATYSVLPDDGSFYAAAAAASTMVAAKYVEGFGFESQDADSILED